MQLFLIPLREKYCIEDYIMPYITLKEKAVNSDL